MSEAWYARRADKSIEYGRPAVSIGRLQVRLVNAALQLLDHAIECGEVERVRAAEADAAFAGADLAEARDVSPDDVAVRDVETTELAARGEAGLF